MVQALRVILVDASRDQLRLPGTGRGFETLQAGDDFARAVQPAPTLVTVQPVIADQKPQILFRLDRLDPLA